MANSYDRNGNDGGGGGFMIGLVAGAVLGAGIGMLLAPKAGAELRGQLGDQARNLGNVANEHYKKASESATEWAGKGREFVDQAREAVVRGVEDARASVSTAAAATPGSDFGRS